MDPQTQLFKRAADAFLVPEDDFFKLKSSIEEIHRRYFEITGIRAFDHENDRDKYLEFGKAVSPVVAADCLFDLLRTKRFIQGIYKAIVHLRKKFNGEKINILYAGSGPYGALITPLCFVFGEDVFTCTAVDVHKESTLALEKILKELKIENYFSRLITCDAFDYQAAENERPHMIVSEVLQMGLRHEPQVALTHHLAPQLRDGGVFIPKEIRLDLFHSKKIPENIQPAVAEPTISRRPEREEDFLGTILTLNLQTVKEQLQISEYPNLRFKPLQVEIPQKRDPDDSLKLHTFLEIYNDVFLTDRQSSLTVPIRMTNLRGYPDNTVFEFEYKLSRKPRAELRILYDGQ